jgi:TolB-like protein/DNA-binding winged helix-turn-helix (wHTH) protein/Tfp pilus assembly protein PilF
MGKGGNNSRVIRTGAFEVDLDNCELRKDTQPVAIEDQPFQILGLLVQRSGKIVTRGEILGKLWPAESAVDPERSLDLAIHRLRQALGETAGKAEYIESIPGRGYRFVAKVSSLPPGRTPTTGSASLRSFWRAGLFRRVSGIGLVLFLAAVVAVVVYVLIPRPPGKVKLAVLPFKNLSGKLEDGPICDGMTDELITRLGRVPPERLGVIASGSVWQFKNSQQSIQEIGHKLAVNYVVEGSVNHDGNQVRISAKLIQVGDETQLWTDSYDRPYEDLLAIERDVAGSVAGSLALKLLPAERARLTALDTASSQAHDAYLKGRHDWGKRTAEGFLKSVEYYKQAIGLDPHYASAYAGLADTYDTLGFYGILPPGESYGKARMAARKALEIDDTLAEAHAALADVLLEYDYDWPGAGGEFQRAIQLNGNYAAAHDKYSVYLALIGNEREGLAENRRAHEHDPVSPAIAVNGALQYFYARKYGQSIAECKEALKLEPNFALGHFWLGRAYQAAGMPSEAVAELRQASQLEPENPLFLTLLGHAFGAAGQRTEAQQILGQLQTASTQHYVSPVLFSLIYVGLADKDQALTSAEKALAEHAPMLTRMKRDPIVDGLRSEPRFQALLRQVGPPN